MTEREVFLAAVEKEDPAERATYLDEICGTDVTLRQRVEALFRSHERASGFMDVPVVEQIAGDREGLDFLVPSQKPGSLGRLDQYEILDVVGRGGMGVVFRALDTKLHRVVAIKALSPQFRTSSAARQRFAREARATAAVTHDNVIAIHTVEDTGPVPYLVMQFIDGPTLQKKLDRTGQLSLKEILRIGLQLAEGLAAAHRQGLVHRDIKPANILLENGIERVKLTDFGLARAGDDASLTHSGMVAGTPMYMSPEQADGKPVNCRSDLFSLGSVLYGMCTGRPPFRAPSPMAVLKRVCEETPRPIREINPEIPPWLEELVARLHAKAPDDRLASAREVADLLARHLADLQHGGRSSVVVQPAAANLIAPESAQLPLRQPRRTRAMVAAALLALVTVLGISEATGTTDVRGTVIRMFSPHGMLVVEVDDPGVNVSLNGEELVITGAGVREIRLKPGQYEVMATKDGKLIRQELVTVSNNGRQVVRVSREPATPQVVAADAAEWEKAVAALPAADQVEAVAARLKDLNPGFNGKVTPTITNHVVTGLKFQTDQVTNVAPVRALSGLKSLDVCGTEETVRVMADQKVHDVVGLQGKLVDLTPLTGLSLTYLRCTRTKVSNLSPLKGMPLTFLDCGLTDVSDLAPLSGMPLKYAFLGGCWKLSDLTPLKGLGLTALDVGGSAVSDLSPLQGLPLKELNLFGAMQVKDLSPLKGMPLTLLHLGRLTVTDLSPIAGMPLKHLWCDYQPERDVEVIRSLKDLEKINNKPVAEFWSDRP